MERGLQMLHSGSPFPQGVTPVPSPSVPNPQDRSFPAIMVIAFRTKYKTPPKSGFIDPGAPPSTMVEEDWVEWVKKGEQQGSTTSEAVKRLMPDPSKDRPARIEWLVVGPAYEAWKRGEATPVTGQPLFAWGGVTRELADELKKWNIYSVEDLANFQDHKLQLVPVPGLRELRRRAQVTIEARQVNDIGAALSERDETIKAQQVDIIAMQARMLALQSTVEALSSQMGVAATQLQAGQPHPDDEFVDRQHTGAGGNVSPSPPPGSRRDPEDKIGEILG